MSDTVVATIIGGVGGIIGAIFGALIAGWQQKANTRVLIESEFKKLSAQISGESRARFRAKKEDWLLEAVSELVYYCDPELRTDYQEVLFRVHKAQLILDPRNPIEDAINRAVTALGLGFRAWMNNEAPPRDLLALQSDVVEATREFFRRAERSGERV